MGYCNKCGAYIPDGLSACLACGYDEDAEKAKSAGGAAAAYDLDGKTDEEIRADEAARARAEKHRRDQQELHRKWAETEQRRRRMEEEFRRRQAEAEERRKAAEGESFQQQGAQQGQYNHLRRAGAAAAASAGTSKALSIMSYISFLCFLPRLLGCTDSYTNFHARQGTKLFFLSVIGSIVGAVTHVGWVFEVLRIYLMVKGIVNAANGKVEKLPIIGEIGDN